MAIEIVGLPIKNGDFPLLCNSSPEGNSQFFVVVHDEIPVGSSAPRLHLAGLPSWLVKNKGNMVMSTLDE